MTFDDLVKFDGKSVKMIKKTGAVYLGTVRRVSDTGGGQFLLVGTTVIPNSDKHDGGYARGDSTKENRNVWLSKVASIELA